MEMYNPPHPGEILKNIYLPDYKLSVTALALKSGISRKHLSNIINCKVPISTEVALKLAKCFNTSAEVWLREQVQVDEYKVMAVEAIRKAGDYFGFRCPLDGEAKVGESWYDTH